MDSSIYLQHHSCLKDAANFKEDSVMVLQNRSKRSFGMAAVMLIKLPRSCKAWVLWCTPRAKRGPLTGASWQVLLSLHLPVCLSVCLQSVYKLSSNQHCYLCPGYAEQKQQIEDTMLLALQHPHVYEAIAKSTRRHYSNNKPRAVLFEGPPGTGKTTSARSALKLPPPSPSPPSSLPPLLPSIGSLGKS